MSFKPDYNSDDPKYIPSMPSEDGIRHYRYIYEAPPIEIKSASKTRKLICIGVNPSDGKPDDEDPTMKKIRERIALFNSNSTTYQYSHFVIINPCPYISSSPKHLPEKIHDEIISENINVTKEYLSKYVSNSEFDIWAGWGNAIEERDYLFTCLARLKEEVIDDLAESINHRIDSASSKPEWIHFGKPTSKKHPRHFKPFDEKNARVNRIEERFTFDINAYLEKKSIEI